MEKCRVLEEYSEVVSIMRENIFVEKDMQTALNEAVDQCIEKGILKNLSKVTTAKTNDKTFEFKRKKY